MAAMAGNQAGHKKTTTNLHPNLQFQKYRNCASDGGCNHTASITVMAGDWLLMNGKVTRSGQQKRSYPKSFARLILILSLREQTHIPHSPFFIGLILLPSLSDSLSVSSSFYPSFFHSHRHSAGWQFHTRPSK